MRAANGQETYTVGLNKYAAMTVDEFADRYLNQKMQDRKLVLEFSCDGNIFTPDNSVDTPSEFSWVNGRQGFSSDAGTRVTNVKDQGSCGSCWSFGGAATFESAMCLDGQQDCSSWSGASEQQLVDCGGKDNTALGPYYDMACNGGWIDNALYYIQTTGFIDGYDNYPYVSGSTKKAGNCVASADNSVGSISNCGATTKNSESELTTALAQVGAVGIAIDAGGIGFQLYSGGVYVSNSCSSTRLNHAVTAVGYGNMESQDYFTVKNSWGTAWGDNGYILMAANRNNQCGVAATPAYAMA
jgi:cathepsin L